MLIIKHPFFQLKSLSKRAVLFIFLLKFFFGLFLQGVYTYYYKDRQLADVYKYYDDAVIIYKQKSSDTETFLEVFTGINLNEKSPRTLNFLKHTSHFDKTHISFFDANHRLMIRLNILFLFISSGNVFIHVLLFCLLSFLGVFLILKRLDNSNACYVKPVYISFTILPSVAFWSSGMLKESLLVFLLGCFFYSYTDFKSLYRFLLLSLSFLALMLLKPLILVLLLFALSIIAIAKNHLSRALKINVFVFLFICLIFAKLPQRAVKIAIGKRNQFIELAHKFEAKSVSDTEYVSPTMGEMLRLFPKAFTDGICRPLFWESLHKPIDLLFSFESLFLALLIGISCTQKQFFEFMREHKIYILLIAIALLYMLILGYIIPIIGAIVRYKVVVLPLLLLPFVHYLTTKSKFSKLLLRL